MAKKTPKPKPQLAAKSQADLADAFAVTYETVKRWRSDGMPGIAGKYVIHDVSEWLRTEGPWRPYQKEQLPPSDDPLMDGVDSPGLERYRLAKAKHAELDLELRRDELIDREKCHDLMSRWGAIIRRMGERLSKRFGNDVANDVNETLGECAAAIREALSDD